MGLTPPPLHGDDLFEDEEGATHGLDLHSVCAQAVVRVRDELHTKAPIDTDYGPMARVSARRAELFQVMVNILLNAADATKRADEEMGRVLLLTRGGADHAVVEVRAAARTPSDAQAAHRVRWEHFGMPVCEKILAGFGGTLSVGTTPGSVATFRVTLPVPRSTVRPPRAAGAPPPSVAIVTPSASFAPGAPRPRKSTQDMFPAVSSTSKKNG